MRAKSIPNGVELQYWREPKGERESIEIFPGEVFDYWSRNADYEPYYGQEPRADKLHYFEAFTTLLWKTTTRVGFGCATQQLDPTHKNHTLVNVVAHFDPPTNVHCRYRQNVLPLTDTPLFRKLIKESFEESAQCSEPAVLFNVPQKGCPVDYVNRILGAINSLRAEHGSPPLQYSNKIALYTQIRANYIGYRDLEQHEQNDQYGYDLIYKSSYAYGGGQIGTNPIR